jgi:hypothetical protein
MTPSEKNDLERLGQLDPARHDAPPAPGSARYNTILEKAMSQTITQTPVEQHRPNPRSRRRWIGWTALTTGVAATAVAVAVSVGGPSVSPASAAASLKAAADQTGKVTSLRFASGEPDSEFSAAGEVNGSDYRTVSKGEGTSSTITVVGRVEYATAADGKTTRRKLSADERPAPFTQAAADVVRAVAADANVEQVGSDSVRGVESKHYRVTLKERTSDADPANPLAELPAAELAWFDLDNVDSYSADVTVDVWVADNLIRRIGASVEGQDSISSNEFYDFNTPITIKAPTAS